MSYLSIKFTMGHTLLYPSISSLIKIRKPLGFRSIVESLGWVWLFFFTTMKKNLGENCRMAEKARASLMIFFFFHTNLLPHSVYWFPRWVFGLIVSELLWEPVKIPIPQNSRASLFGVKPAQQYRNKGSQVVMRPRHVWAALANAGW